MTNSRIILTAGVGWLLALALWLSAPAMSVNAQSSAPEEPYPGQALCLPDAYLLAPIDCLPLGPSQMLTALAMEGISYPPKPLPGTTPAREYTVNPVQIAKINLPETEPAYIYATLDDAAAGSSPTRQINPGETRYVSYYQVAQVDGNAFVQLKTGEWMRASPAGTSHFQGLLFRQTPTTSFGWMLDTIAPYSSADWGAPQVGETRQRESVIQVYEEKLVGDMEWYRIGQDEWVPWHKARRVKINTTPPKGVTGNRWIEINLYDQVVMVYENRQLVFATLVATGAEPLYTRPGLFQIFEKHELYTMTTSDPSDYYYLEDVPYTMFFDQARALHGAYWRPYFGWPGTHGCVNFSIGDSAWLFEWAEVGDWVYVWDPSGATPTDPSLYSEGGA
jgi:hypothetical protein